MEKAESEFSIPENPAGHAFLGELSAAGTLAEILAPASDTESGSQFFHKVRQLKLGIIEILFSIILGIIEYWLWLHWVVIQYNFSLKHGAIIAHLFRIQPFAAVCIIILIALSCLCLIDAIRRIIDAIRRILFRRDLSLTQDHMGN